MADKTRTSVRARVRAGMIEEIKTIAVRQLAEGGTDLSLRAVARELGMVSSAIYRYFPCRDDLLTALLIDGYNDLGLAAERAEAEVSRRDLRGRYLAMATAMRRWAVEHPAEYALLYGSPIPGYRAPADTVGPAGRAALVLGGILRDAAKRGRFADEPPIRLPRQVRADLVAASHGVVMHGIPETVADRALASWVQIFGAISLELFGHLVGTIDHPKDWFEHRVTLQAREIGL